MNISTIINRIGSCSEPTFTLAITGGSGSGKSFLSNEIQTWCLENGHDVAVLHLDDFALGKEFPNKKTSPYRWDDPANYRLDEAYRIYEKLKNGTSHESFRAYTLEAHKPSVDKTISWHIAPQKAVGKCRVLVVEGLFSWYGPFEAVESFRVFLHVNFYHRFVLRAYRNSVLSKTADLSTVTRQFFDFVARAHQDFLVPAEKSADLVLENNFDLRELEPTDTNKTSTTDTVCIYEDAVVQIYFSHHTHILFISTARGVLIHGVLDEDARAILENFQNSPDT